MYFFFKKKNWTDKQKDDMLSECMFAHICLFHSALSICHGCRKNSYYMPAPIYPHPLSDAERLAPPNIPIRQSTPQVNLESQGPHQENVTAASHMSLSKSSVSKQRCDHQGNARNVASNF